jgi:hypothetical protein
MTYILYYISFVPHEFPEYLIIPNDYNSFIVHHGILEHLIILEDYNSFGKKKFDNLYFAIRFIDFSYFFKISDRFK